MSNFFEIYNNYVKDTEPPPNYHAWSAVATISAILGKKCQIPQGSFTVFPNLYIVLVGDPGMRKSTAMNIAKRLVRLVKEVPVAAESGSREGLLDDMAKNKVYAIVNGKDVSYWQAAAFVTEMQEFLGGKHINSSMVGFLTAIWDEPIFKENTRKAGSVTILNPYFSFLGCCTPNWMNEKLKQDVITDGFSRRTIFVLETELNCLNPWPRSTPEQLESLARLSNEANRMFQICGTFDMSIPAYEIYADKYRSFREEAKHFTEKVQSYFTSKHILALKIAMCISAGLNSDRLITTNIIKAAFTFLEQSERGLDIVFSGVGRNELKSYLDKAANYIKGFGHKGISKAEFATWAYSDLNKQEIDEIWEQLTLTELAKPVGLVSVQDVPRLRANESKKIAPAVNLLKLASLLTSLPEPRMVESSAFSIASHLAPEAEQLLSLAKQWRVRSGSGKLLLGKKPQVPDGKPNSSGSPVG